VHENAEGHGRLILP